MARMPRSALPERGIYHVTARGVDRCAIVRDDVDRAGFVGLLRSAARRERIAVHAFCLMDNHFHAIFEGSLGQLSRVLHRL